MSNYNDRDLTFAAERAMRRAYAPYSRFMVGAALLCSDGTVFTGCNIENSSYGLTICAERAAIFSAISFGHADFVKIAIVGGHEGVIENICPPCGACRQVMSEFCNPDFEIILWDGRSLSPLQSYRLDELLPLGFNL